MNRTVANRTLGRRALVLASLTLLGGCGFHPVYMPTASGKAGPAQRDMQAVFVDIIPDRPGQILRQALQERLASDSGVPARYTLSVSFGIPGEAIAIQQNSIATRVRMTGMATWTLKAHDAKETVLTSGHARAIGGLNVFDAQYFAADQETEAVQAQLAQEVATQIATQLAVWFDKQAAHDAS